MSTALIERLRAHDLPSSNDAADEIERLRAELYGISRAIGTTRYMDPPDGGVVPLAEQVRRMRAENEELRDLLDEAHAYLFEIESVKSRTGYSGRDVWLSDFLNRINAAMEKDVS